MRSREGFRPRLEVWLQVKCKLVLVTLAAVSLCASAPATATTLGAFELRLNEMRAPQAEERLLDYALVEEAAIKKGAPGRDTSDILAQVVNRDEPAAEPAKTQDQPKDEAETSAAAEPKSSQAMPAEAKSSDAKAAETGGGGAKEGAAANAAGNGAGTQPAPSVPPIVASPTTNASTAKPERVHVPRAGESDARGFYDTRARELLKSEDRRGRENFGVEIEAGTSVVVCIGGCQGNEVGVVYVAAARPVNAEVEGEMTQTAARVGGAADTDNANAIACIAGCYDDSPKVYSSRGVESSKREIQKAIDRSTGKAATPADDWLTTQKKSSGAAPAARPKSSRGKLSGTSEKPGAWLTRIIKARERDAGRRNDGSD